MREVLVWGMGRGADAGIPRGLPLFCTAFGQREHALFGGRMERGWGHYSTNENSTEFETVRASDSYISREKRTHREGNRRNEYTYMYIYDARNTKLSIIHGSHDR